MQAPAPAAQAAGGDRVGPLRAEILVVEHLVVEQVPQGLAFDPRLVEQARDRDHLMRLVEGGEHRATLRLRPGHGRNAKRPSKVVASDRGKERDKVVEGPLRLDGAPPRARLAHLEREFTGEGVAKPRSVSRLGPARGPSREDAGGKDMRDGRLRVLGPAAQVLAQRDDELAVGGDPRGALQGRVAPVPHADFDRGPAVGARNLALERWRKSFGARKRLGAPLAERQLSHPVPASREAARRG